MGSIVKRSYHGCSRCKRRRQKCDENKPSCERCLDAGVVCEYKITLKWNGRVPRQKKPSSAEGSQATRLVSRNADVRLSDSDSKSTISLPDRSRVVTLSSYLQQPLSTLSSKARFLLHYFITEASMVSSHAYIRDQICRDILPMVLQSDSLLYATMAFSALHRSTVLNEIPNQFMPEKLVSDLISASVRCLRRELAAPGYRTQPLLHTIRTLCHCEIYSGSANSSWRVHVNGAGAMFAEVASRRDLDHSEYSFWLWSRWFWSIRALTAVALGGTLSEMALEEELTLQNGDQDYFFDIYTGYSSDLNIALVQIGVMARTCSLGEDIRCQDNGGHSIEDQDKARHLEQMIRDMISRDSNVGLKFPDHLSLNEETICQFRASNTAYQNASLILLYRRIRNLPSFCYEVQGCVREILDTVCAILPVTTLSPWILLTTPIYTAGCEAFGQDRRLVKSLLLELYSKLHIRNILRALEILEYRWTILDCSGDSFQGPVELYKRDGMQSAEDFLDFIPY